MSAKRAVGPRAALGLPGAAAGEVEQRDVVGAGRDGEGSTVVGQSQQIDGGGAGAERQHLRGPRGLAQFRRRSRRIDENRVDLHAEDVSDLFGGVSRSHTHDATAERVRRHVSGERFRRDGRADRDAPARAQTDAAHGSRQPADDLHELPS